MIYFTSSLGFKGGQNHQTPVHQIVVEKKQELHSLHRSLKQLVLEQINEIKLYTPDIKTWYYLFQDIV